MRYHVAHLMVPIAIGLTAPGSAAQSISAAIARESHRLAVSDPVRRSVPVGWERVMSIPNGTSISLTTNRQRAATMIAATEHTLFVLHEDSAAVPAALRDRLREIAQNQPSQLIEVAAGRVVLEFEDFQVTAAGVWRGSSRLDDLSAIIEAVPAVDVLLVQRTARARAGGAVGATIGGALGALFGPLLGRSLQPDCHCDDPGLAGTVYGFWVGVPAGAVGGFLIGARSKIETIYRRSG